MPNQNYSPPTATATALFLGYSSSLALAVKKALENLNISVSHTPTQTPPTYCYYFLPQTLSNPANSAKIQKDLDRVLDTLSSPTKFCLVMRHPDEYYFTHHPTLFPQFSTQESQVISHQNHLLSCLDIVRKHSSTNSRIIVTKDNLGDNINRDAPLLIECPFLFLPTPVKFLNQSPIVSPLSCDDAAKVIIKTVFSQHSRHQIYTISGSQPIPLSSLSQQISLTVSSQPAPLIVSLETKKFHLPSTVISVKTTQPLSEIIASVAQAALNLNLTTPPEPKAALAAPSPNPAPFPSPKMIKKSPSPPPPVRSPNLFPKNRPPAPTNYSKTGLILAVISLLIIMLFGSPLAYLYFAGQTYRAASAFDLKKAVRTARISQNFFPLARPMSLFYIPLVRLTVGELNTSQINTLLTKTNNLLASVNKLPDVVTTGNLLVAKMLAGEKGDVIAPLNTINTYTQTVYEEVSSLEAFLSGIDQSQIKPDARLSLQSTLDQIRRGRVDLKNAAAFLSVAGQFSGSQGSKTYLLLLQNNHELRATGGFIGSFALVTFDQGKLIDIETHDVYAADGQLRGHVEPPSALKKHLGEANWYLRDSNWDPNFPTSARRAEWFLSKEMNRQVDGTIAVDLYTVQNLLKIIGEIHLPDYDETIDADNLFARAEYHSEINFFAGSTQKKDFISAIINALYVKIANPTQEQGIGLLRVLLDSAKQSHLQISVRDEAVESILEDTIFSGKVVDPNCPQAEPNQCLVDYLGVVDSNVGVNKVNYFINRQISHQITVRPNEIETVTAVTWENTAETSAWPAGNYKNYVRLVVPQYASVISLNIGGQTVLAKDLDIEVRHKKKYIGTYLEVPIAGQKTLELTTRYSLNPDQKNGYYLYPYIEKQSGTNQDPLQISLKNLSDFQLFLNNLPLVDNQFNHKTALTGDQSYYFELRP